MTVFDKWTIDDDKYLIKLLKNASTSYSVPDYDEVISELKSTSIEDEEDAEIIVEDLIVRYFAEDNMFELEWC